MYKVHWIIDGIANVNEKTQEDAENVINSKIQKFLSEHSDFFDKIGSGESSRFHLAICTIASLFPERADLLRNILIFSIIFNFLLLTLFLIIVTNPSYSNNHNNNLKNVYENLRNKQFTEAINKLKDLSEKINQKHNYFMQKYSIQERSLLKILKCLIFGQTRLSLVD